MRITISGLSGSGTTTIARLLSKELGMELISAGEMFRAMAKDRNLLVEQFSEVAEHTDEFDRWVDRRQREEAMKRDDLIIEGRLSGFFVPQADLKIWLKAPMEVRARRVASREKIAYEDALSAMKRREQSEYMRYAKYYGIHLDDLSLYDLVIDSSRWNESGILKLILVAKEHMKRGL